MWNVKWLTREPSLDFIIPIMLTTSYQHVISFILWWPEHIQGTTWPVSHIKQDCPNSRKEVVKGMGRKGKAIWNWFSTWVFVGKGRKNWDWMWNAFLHHQHHHWWTWNWFVINEARWKWSADRWLVITIWQKEFLVINPGNPSSWVTQTPARVARSTLNEVWRQWTRRQQRDFCTLQGNSTCCCRDMTESVFLLWSLSD